MDLHRSRILVSIWQNHIAVIQFLLLVVIITFKSGIYFWRLDRFKTDLKAMKGSVQWVIIMLCSEHRETSEEI